MAQRRIFRRDTARSKRMASAEFSKPPEIGVCDESTSKFEFVDAKLIEILRSNYDLLSVIAEIDTPLSTMTTNLSSPTVNRNTETKNSIKTPVSLSATCNDEIADTTQRKSSATTWPPAQAAKSRFTLRAKKSLIIDGDITSHELSTSSSDSSDKGYSARPQKTYNIGDAQSAQDKSSVQKIDEWKKTLTLFASNVLRAITSEPIPPSSPTTKQESSKNSSNANGNNTSNSSNATTTTLPKLSPHTLRRDIKRCLNQLQHYLNIGTGLYDLVVWRNPIATLAIFTIYMYGVWCGYFVPMVLFLVLAQFGINWLETQRNISVGIFLLPHRSTSIRDNATVQPSGELTGTQLVFDVARRAQCLLTLTADVLEKLHALVAWKRPEITAQFVAIVATFFVLSIVLSTSSWFILIGSLIGGKIFLMTYFYHRFLRLRQLLDITYYFYTRLPTAVEELSPSRSNRYSSRSFSMRNSLSVCRNRALMPTLSATGSCSGLLRRHASSIDIAVAVATMSNFATLKSVPSTGAMLSPLIKSAENEQNGAAKKRRQSICVMNAGHFRASTAEPFHNGLISATTTAALMSPNSLNSPRISIEAIDEATEYRPITPMSRALQFSTTSDYQNYDDRIHDDTSATDVENSDASTMRIQDMSPQEQRVSGSDRLYDAGQDGLLLTSTSSINSSDNTHALDGEHTNASGESDEEEDDNSMDSSPSSRSASYSDTDLRMASPTFRSNITKRGVDDHISNFAEDLIRISRSCFMTTKSKLIDDPVKAGVLTLSEKMLSFHFNLAKCSNRLTRLRRIFCRNGKCMAFGPASLDIPFPSIIQLKKLDRSTYYRRGSNSSLLLSILRMSNSVGEGGIELCLAHDYAFNIGAAQSKQSRDGCVVVRFTGISRLDEFYNALVDIARISADVDLIDDNESLARRDTATLVLSQSHVDC